jgi:phage shock protein C
MKYNRHGNGNKLYRNRNEAIFFGVCAGLADFLGFDRTVTRVITVLAALLFPPTVVVAYFILGLLLQKAPESGLDQSSEQYRLTRRIRAEPHATLDSIRHRFRELDRRLQRLEKHVTSKKFRLEREFEGLRD